jgi:TetR/AcrR family transcriptional regulator, transcriptional repressor for nem operon
MPLQKITREEILLKTLEVFRRQGYYNTSMSDLAIACGLNKSSFYHYFESKEVLMQTILEETRGYLKQYVFSIADDDSLSPNDKLTKFLLKHKQRLLSKNGTCFIGNTTLETALHIPQFAEILRGIFEDFTLALQRIYSARYSNEVAYSIAQQTVMELQGAVMMGNLYRNEDMLKQAYERAMRRLLAG